MHRLALRGTLIAALFLPLALAAQENSPDFTPPGPEMPGVPEDSRRHQENSQRPRRESEERRPQDQAQPQQPSPQESAVEKQGAADIAAKLPNSMRTPTL